MPSVNPAPAFVTVDCPVCGSNSKRVRWETPLGEPAPLESYFRCTNSHYGRFGRIVQCRSCGLLYRDPQEVDVLGAYGEAVDEDYLAAWPARRVTFEGSLRQLHRLITPPGRLLDVGCSAGYFLQVARAAGWDTTGLEPSEWAAGVARRQGLRVEVGTLAAHPFAAGEFDAVTLWDVIEHVKDPRATIAEAWRLLRPGGVIGLTTMDVGSPVARLLGPRWPHLMRMHLWYFTSRHVSRLLAEAGFEQPVCRPHVRVLSAGYLASRFAFAGEGLARSMGALIRAVGAADRHVKIYTGDLFAAYARKPG